MISNICLQTITWLKENLNVALIQVRAVSQSLQSGRSCFPPPDTRILEIYVRRNNSYWRPCLIVCFGPEANGV